MALSGKDGKDRKHGVVQTFWIYLVINLGYYEIADLS